VFDPTYLDYENAPGTGLTERRLQELDQDGIDAEIIFALHARNTSIRDKDAFIGILRAYNDFMLQEFCVPEPDRLIWVGLLPNIGADEDIAEMERCAKMGVKAMVLCNFPSGQSFPSAEDDRFWAAAVEMGMPLTIHTSLPHRVAGRGTSLFKYPKEPEGESRPPIDYLERIARHGIPHSGALEATQLVLSGVFDRFPTLQIYWAENNIGWIPYFYEQMDQAYETNRFWAERFMGMKPLKQLPSEYLKQHALWGFWDDRTGVELRHKVGVDRIMWSNDFPHVVTQWPNSLRLIEKQLGDVPADEKRLILAENAIKFFKLDGVAASEAFYETLPVRA
jgi:predicted TIM-barrel fold metal-dependent hydrolase